MKTDFAASMLMVAVVAGAGVLGSAFAQNTAQNTKDGPMPYTTVDHPQFVPASQAGFLANDDLLIGISRRGVTKAYPAADLAQHGVVQDQMPDGPIAVTW